MNTDSLRVLQKLRMDRSIVGAWGDLAAINEIDVRACTEVRFSSEHPQHRIEHLFDGTTGDGASSWVAGRRDRAETILFLFDEPTDISCCVFEAEERELMRTQQVIAEYLLVNSDTYRQCFVQEFNFSPEGATYQRERIDLNLLGVTRLRFTLYADKSRKGIPRLTALRLFSCP